MVEPDHLVLAAHDLDAGAAWMEQHLGVALAAGGKHPRMGTHNRLLGLGDNFYLELIAIDTAAAPPERPRWFALDRLQASDRPRLIHWVARSDDILRDAAGSAEPLGEILPMERGDYRWRISVPVDASHSLAVLSDDPVRILSPSGEKATERTSPVWPEKVRISAPLAASHSLAVRSHGSDPVRI